MSEKFCSLIFDLDGTLWDCAEACAIAYNTAFESHGLPQRITREFVRSIAGKPADECDEQLLDGTPLEMRASVLQSFKDEEARTIAEFADRALYPGVGEGLAKLKPHYGLFVVSNCDEQYLQTFLANSSIGELFLDSECFGRTKRQKHENILAVSGRNNLRTPCYIGDTRGDQDAAYRAGVPFFHAGYGFGLVEGEPVSFASFSDLTRYFTVGS